jgi:hypothetical protein
VGCIFTNKYSKLTCSLIYLGDRDWKECGLRSAWAKSSQDTLSTNKKAGHSDMCPSSQLCRQHKQKDRGPGWSGHTRKTLFEKQQKQKRLGCGPMSFLKDLYAFYWIIFQKCWAGVTPAKNVCFKCFISMVGFHQLCWFHISQLAKISFLF